MIIFDDEKKYCLFGGYVRSKNDGQVHYVSGRDLIDLYGLPPRQCVVAPLEKLYWRMPSNLIALGVRNDGNYTIPTETTKPTQSGVNL